MIQSSIAGYPILLPEHRHAFHQERPNWHKAWLDSIHESLKPDDVVIDVGAEQGDLSALVASWVPDGGVVLVEPQPLFWPTIRETFEANGLKPPRESFAGFASTACRNGEPTDGWPRAADNPTVDEVGFYHLNEHLETGSIRVDCLYPADMILIDVEGAELFVLQGAELLLTENRSLIWCAIHPEIMRDRYGHDPNDLMAFMKRRGYEAELLGFQGEVHARFSPR